MKIGNIELSGRMSLAPMAGVTDAAFRSVCALHGAALTCSEMVSSRALVYRDKKTESLLTMGTGLRSEGVQIFGSDAIVMGEAAQLALEISGAGFIDINMGCPVGKISKSGDGAALMRDPEKAMGIIEAVVRSVDVPVTVKIRKGWDKGSANAAEFAEMAEAAGVSAVAVHGRTKVQMYSGTADWDIIREVKNRVRIPVIANGDVWTGENARRILKYTGADIAMVGRGAFGNPWIFAEGNSALEGADSPQRPSLAQRVDTALNQAAMAADMKGQRVAILEARRHFVWYLKGTPHSGFFKKDIVKMETLDEMRMIAERIKRELR